jgi:hypothetical protein
MGENNRCPIRFFCTTDLPICSLSIIQNASIGHLANPERHRDLGFLVMETPYLETGVRIDNILRIRYVRLGWIGVGAAAFYRWGAYSDLDWRKNVAPRVAFKFTL